MRSGTKLKTPAPERHGGYNYLVRSGSRFRAAIGLGLAGAANQRRTGSVIAGCQDVHVIAIRVMAPSPDAAIEAPTGDGASNDAELDHAPVSCSATGVVPIVCPPSALVGPPPLGFASWLGMTTGGQGGQVVTAATLGDLIAYAAMTVPLVIQVRTTIDLTGQIPNMIPVQSNKTIRGIAPGAGLVGGGLWLYNAENIIVQNLTISLSLGNDAITVQHAQRIWIDHCDLSSEYDVLNTKYDGLIDVTHASDYVTVSWNHFHDHQDDCLVGGSPDNGLEDTGHLTVTYHHNWFVHVRNHSPRARFGSVHVYNNLYKDIAATAVISTMGASVFVERNVFQNVIEPILTHYNDLMDGTAAESENAYECESGVSQIGSMTTTWRPPYTYDLDSIDNVKVYVPGCAGPQF